MTEPLTIDDLYLLHCVAKNEMPVRNVGGAYERMGTRDRAGRACIEWDDNRRGWRLTSLGWEALRTVTAP